MIFSLRAKGDEQPVGFEPVGLPGQLSQRTIIDCTYNLWSSHCVKKFGETLPRVGSRPVVKDRLESIRIDSGRVGGNLCERRTTTTTK